MSKSWPKVRLGDVLRPVARPLDAKPDEMYREIGIRSHGKGVFHKAPVSGLELGDKRVFWMQPGDFVLNIVFAWEGAAAVLSEAEAGMIGSHRFPTFRADEPRLDSRFLLAYLKTHEGRALLGKVSPGGAGRNRTLSKPTFLNQLVPLPPLAQQRRVVSQIEELSAQIHEARAVRQQAAAEADVLWAQGAAKIFDHAVETHPIRQLAELVSVRGGGTPSKSNPFYWQGSVPWISPKDMKTRELHDAIDHISEQAAKETPAKFIEPGAVLVVVRGMILAHTFPSAILRARATINQDMKALLPTKELLPEFLSGMFWAYNQRVLKLVEKSTHDTRKLETAKLLDTKIAVPPLPEQRRIVAELDALTAELNELKRLQAETAAELDALLPALLDRAFHGEL